MEGGALDYGGRGLTMEGGVPLKTMEGEVPLRLQRKGPDYGGWGPP